MKFNYCDIRFGICHWQYLIHKFCRRESRRRSQLLHTHCPSCPLAGNFSSSLLFGKVDSNLANVFLFSFPWCHVFPSVVGSHSNNPDFHLLSRSMKSQVCVIFSFGCYFHWIQNCSSMLQESPLMRTPSTPTPSAPSLWVVSSPLAPCSLRSTSSCPPSGCTSSTMSLASCTLFSWSWSSPALRFLSSCATHTSAPAHLPLICFSTLCFTSSLD